MQTDRVEGESTSPIASCHAVCGDASSSAGRRTGVVAPALAERGWVMSGSLARAAASCLEALRGIETVFLLNFCVAHELLSPSNAWTQDSSRPCT